MKDLYIANVTLHQAVGEPATITMWTTEEISGERQHIRQEFQVKQDETPESLADWLRLVFAATTEAL